MYSALISISCDSIACCGASYFSKCWEIWNYLVVNRIEKELLHLSCVQNMKAKIIQASFFK